MGDRLMGLWADGLIGLWAYRLMGLLACCVLCLISFALFAQEVNDEENKEIDLPAVKIEILDTTQVDIPREKFRSFTKPDPGLYKPLKPKERPWYLPATSIPEKYQEELNESEKDFLFSLTAYSGVPLILAYHMLVVREFGSSEALLDMGRATLQSGRTGNLIGDSSKELDIFTIDKLKGVLAYQSDRSSLKADVKYDGKDLAYLDLTGNTHNNDRSLAGLYASWGQKLSSDVQSSLSIGVSKLRLEDPISAESHNGWDLKTDFSINFPWPRYNPIDAGASIGYFNGNSESEEFKEAIIRLYIQDKYIRMWYFILGAGAEFMLDIRNSSPGDGSWEPDIYLNPHLLLMSYLGPRTILRIGVERHVLRQDLGKLYLDSNYIRFNPGLDPERTWDLNASLQYRFMRKFAATVGAFDKEIRNLLVFAETSDGILSWEPESRDSARIFGFKAELELSQMDGRLKQTAEYIHESHDDERIPYRPEDRGILTVKYLAPFGLELSLSGELYGTRYVDTGTGESSLSGYFLWKPRISRTFGKYASAFVSAEIYTGEDDYQIWRRYELPAQVVDFGLTLRF